MVTHAPRFGKEKKKKKGSPTFIAGVPPDYFSVTGQRWGNPLYDWPKHKANGFKFWINRLEYNSTLFDVIRMTNFSLLC